MKKVINMNLGGRLVNIEEDAYARLQQYLESLKQHFAGEEGRDEIVGDIENRIAEIFADKHRKGIAAISVADVEEVIASIGRPEDFDDNTENNTTSGTTAENRGSTREKRGRLYRNSEDKAIGGVCSGLAAYFNLDVSLVRIIWAVLVFAGGTGILLYILLWIVLPENRVESKVEHRLYRNPDDRMIGGVAGGIASYFGIEVWIPRLIFAFPFLIAIIATVFRSIAHDWWSPGFIFTGSFGGTTLIAYIILWMVIPEANTVSEKMAMRGEKVDLNSIKNNIQEEMRAFGDRAQKWGSEISEKSREWSGRTQRSTRRASRGVGHALLIIVKGFFLFIGGIIAFSLLIALIAILASGVGLLPFSNFFFDGFWQTFFGWCTFIFFLVVPVLSLIVWIVRRARGAQRNRSLTIIFGLLWGFGFISATFFAATVTRDLSTSAYSDSNLIKLAKPAGNSIYVTVKENPYNTRRWIQYGGLERLTADSLQASFINLQVEPSADNDFHLRIQRKSLGRDEAQAIRFAEDIRYGYAQTDSVLTLDRFFTITRNSKFRFQHINLTLYVPKGGSFTIDESVEEYFTNFSVNHSPRRRRRIDNIEFFQQHNWEANKRTTMGEGGAISAPAGEQDDNLDQKEKDLQNQLKKVKEEKEQQELQRRADSIKRDAERKIDSLNRKSVTGEPETREETEDDAAGNFVWPTEPFFRSPLALMNAVAVPMLS